MGASGLDFERRIMKPDFCICQKCKHDMKRSRVKDGKVRCNKCKTVYTVTINWDPKP